MTENDFDRTARLWLEDGPTDMPDRALLAALDEIHVTRQRRALWPARRFSSMGNTTRLAVGVAAIVVVAFVGIGLVSSKAGGAGGAAATATPAPHELTVGSIASLEPGAYVTADPFLARVTFTVPAGWGANMGGPYALWLDQTTASGPEAMSFLIFDSVYADACHYDKGLAHPGPTVDALATALATMPGLDATTPTDVTLGGYQGKQLTLTAPASTAGCTLAPDGYAIWQLPLGAIHSMMPGERDRVWILDVDGQRLVIDAAEVPGQTAEAKAEIQGILDSIRIAPITSPTPKPS